MHNRLLAICKLYTFELLLTKSRPVMPTCVTRFILSTGSNNIDLNLCGGMFSCRGCLSAFSVFRTLGLLFSLTFSGSSKLSSYTPSPATRSSIPTTGQSRDIRTTFVQQLLLDNFRQAIFVFVIFVSQLLSVNVYLETFVRRLL